MRIGILTFHKVVNYGAYLQAFSLSNKLKKCFTDAEVEIVDYMPPKGKKRKIYTILWNIKHHGIKGGFAEIKKIRAFNKMIKHLSLSPKSFCTNNLEKMYSYINERYDMLIIGSDAVFNWKQTGFPTAFIPDYPFTIPVYTYAASVHGLKFYDETNDKKQLCAKVFESMNCIGVRDNCSEKFVKYCSDNTKTLHCCDPTLFIDKEEISKRGSSIKSKLEKKYNFSTDSKYIVVMAPDSALVKTLSERYGKDYKIVSVFVKSAFSDLYIYDLNPFEWTVILKHASLVVTSYFHGTLLSLVQNTPVIVLDYSGFCDDKYESKLKDLMTTRFSLDELYSDKEFANSFDSDDSFLQMTDKLLEGAFSERIRDAVDTERKTADTFFEVVRNSFAN